MIIKYVVLMKNGRERIKSFKAKTLEAGIVRLRNLAKMGAIEDIENVQRVYIDIKDTTPIVIYEVTNDRTTNTN